MIEHELEEHADREDLMSDTVASKVGVFLLFPRQLMRTQGSNRRSTEGSHLLSLPPELRNSIYELVTGPHVEVNFVDIPEFSNQTTTIEKCQWTTMQITISRTCKAMRTETLSIFYDRMHFTGSLLSFELADTLATFRWLKGIGSDNRKLLKHCSVEWWVGMEDSTLIQQALG